MTESEHLSILRTHFARLRRMDDAGRAEYLRDMDRGDETLRSDLDDLLTHYDDLDGFLEPEDPVSLLSAESPPPASRGRHVTLHADDRVGPYRILETLGEGGMGIVYLAEQLEPVQRRVALKVVKPGMDSREIIARFETERQTLAMMDHPNVAHVFDAGTTATGRPYFVLEHVPGQPINRYCDKVRMSVEDRIRLFIDVCSAVQHAHQKGIIHRDLKPSNVLVTDQGGSVLPKVIDFGVAKAVSPRMTGRTLFTAHGQLIGTPEFMSPEQAEMSGLNVDTHTDVYALGAMLYNLLTGRLPFESDELRTGGIADIQRTIREVEPPRPSARFAALSASEKDRISTRASSDPRTHARDLRGDLDWIVMRAMEKDRTRRYANVSDLAADLDRYLSVEPVLAGPPSTVYRLKKFFQRNRAAALSVTLITLALVFGIIGTTWMAIKADNQARKAKQISEFWLEGLTMAQPQSVEQATQAFADVLVGMGTLIDEKFEGQPEHEARVRLTFGAILRFMNRHRVAETHLTRAIALLDDREESDEDLLQARRHLAMVQRDLGQMHEASERTRAVLAIRTAASGPYAHETLVVQRELALILRWTGEFEEARRLLRDVIEARQDSSHAVELHPENRRELFKCQHGLGMTFFEEVVIRRIVNPGSDNAGLLSRALHDLKAVYESQVRELDEGHVDIFTTQHNLGRILAQQGMYDDAITQLRAALAGREGVHPLLHVNRLSSMHVLGMTLCESGAVEEGRSILEKAYELRLAAEDRRAPQTIQALANLAGDAGDTTRQRELWIEAIVFGEKFAEPWDSRFVAVRLGYVTYLLHAGDADALEEQVQFLRTAITPVGAPNVFPVARLMALQTLVRVYTARGEDDLATTTRREADDLRRQLREIYD